MKKYAPEMYNPEDIYKLLETYNPIRLNCDEIKSI